MKNHKHTNGIRIAFCATFLLLASLNLSAQYKLELVWQKEPGGASSHIFGVAKSDVDSVLYVSIGKSIMQIRAIDGETIKIYPTEFEYVRLIMSKDGNNVIATTTNAGEFGMGILEPTTFQRKFWIKYPNYADYTYNENQNKLVVNYSPDIRIFDLTTQKLDKEIKTGLELGQVNITDDGKHIVYTYKTYSTMPKQTHNILRICDLEGNVLKEIRELSTGTFSFTVDGKSLIYFDSNSTIFCDLESFQTKEVFQIGGNVGNIEMSSDGKFMLVTKGFELYYFEFETRRTFLLNDNTSWSREIKLNSTNTELFFGVGYLLYKLKITTLNSILDIENKYGISLEVKDNLLYVKFANANNVNKEIQFKILTIDGKYQNPLLVQSDESKLVFNISDLATGVYFLQLEDKDKTIGVFKFTKVN